MEFSQKYYDNTDIETGIMWHEMDKKVRSEMKKQEEPKTKPAEVFEGFKDTKKNAKKQINRKPAMKYSKEDTKKDYRK